MHRRRLLTSLAVLAFGAARPGFVPAVGPGYRVPLQQLQEALAERFPLRYPIAGLVDLDMAAPRLRLLPELNRLGTQLLVHAAGPALRRSYSGELELDFALRYEAADRTIRAHRLRVQSLRMPGLAAPAAALLERSASQLADEALLEVVLHRLRPRDLALADTMGLQPGAITVTPAGLAIEFVNKAAP